MAPGRAVAAQGHADRGGRDPNAEVQQLALDALVAPAGVLRGEADDQQLHVLVESWPAGVALRVGPGAGDEAPVPAQQRVGLDEEAGPHRPGQHAADRGQQRPVSGLEPGSWDLAAKDGELVAQHQDLMGLWRRRRGRAARAPAWSGTPRGTRASIAPGTASGESTGPKRTELPSDTNQQATGHVRVCAPFTPVTSLATSASRRFEDLAARRSRSKAA